MDEQGLQARRAVANDRPRLGAFNGLTMGLSESHQTLRSTDPAIREPRPTRSFRPSQLLFFIWQSPCLTVFLEHHREYEFNPDPFCKA